MDFHVKTQQINAKFIVIFISANIKMHTREAKEWYLLYLKILACNYALVLYELKGSFQYGFIKEVLYDNLWEFVCYFRREKKKIEKNIMFQNGLLRF